MRTIEELSFCTHCKVKLGAHHMNECIHFGPVIPSECRGLIDAVIIDILEKRKKP